MRGRSEIPTFPQLRRRGRGKVENQKQVSHFPTARDIPENKYLLQRYMLHTDVHLGSRFRFFGQLKSGIEVNRVSGPRPADAIQQNRVALTRRA